MSDGKDVPVTEPDSTLSSRLLKDLDDYTSPFKSFYFLDIQNWLFHCGVVSNGWKYKHTSAGYVVYDINGLVTVVDSAYVAEHICNAMASTLWLVAYTRMLENEVAGHKQTLYWVADEGGNENG